MSNNKKSTPQPNPSKSSHKIDGSTKGQVPKMINPPPPPPKKKN